MEVTATYFIAYFIIGLLLPIPWLFWVNRLSIRHAMLSIGSGLVIAAIIYIGFALYHEDSAWLLLEVLGVAFYGLFFWLAMRHSMLWLAMGWGLHPVWDAALHWLGPGAHIVPPWYAIACLSFDITVAIYVVAKARNVNALAVNENR